MPKWNGTMKGVMGCLIQCANFYSGKCCPSEQWMAEKLECTDRAVRGAVNKIEKKFPKFLQVYHRSQPGRSEWKANGYVIGWKALINRCHVAFPSTDKRRNECSTAEEQTFQARRNKPSCELIERELIEGTYRRKTAHPPSAADALLDSSRKKKEAFSEELVADSQPLQQPPALPEGPSSAEAHTAISEYCTAFHWDHLTDEAYSAAVEAELHERRSGLAVVNAATQEAWKAKRKGAAK